MEKPKIEIMLYQWTHFQLDITSILFHTIVDGTFKIMYCVS